MSKLSFDKMFAKMQMFPNTNLEYFEEKFAEIWSLPIDKAFKKQVESLGAAPGGMPAGPAGPQMSPAKAAGIEAPIQQPLPAQGVV